ncbi:MAG: replication initiation protein RepC [Pseudomonadota bacterium]
MAVTRPIVWASTYFLVERPGFRSQRSAVAAASIALILDKSTVGEVKLPGGYLRGLVERAKVGELHLDRSFYGRLSAAWVYDAMVMLINLANLPFNSMNVRYNYPKSP